jgi:metal-responsive CopG/Arc/MetJ family transcriptional regulator
MRESTMTNNKMMTSIKLQKLLHHKMQQRVISDGYGMRGKSKWIIEAIERFLEIPDYPALADIAGDMDQLSDLVSIRLPESLMLKIDQAIIKVRRHYPVMEGVKSNLIRASIMQRLLREPTSVTEV